MGPWGRVIEPPLGVLECLTRILPGKDPAKCYQALATFYLPLCDWLRTRKPEKRPFLLAISGAQGSGKSTLARVLSELMASLHGWQTARFSLDDLYLTHQQRMVLGQEVHPLLSVRGVPGTHDLPLGHRTLDALLAGSSVALPRFDKADDDRLPRSHWPLFEGMPDLVIVEGWCMGAPALPPDSLTKPLNDLERLEDRECRWRRYQARCLAGAYQSFFDRFDDIIFLAVPDFSIVHRWRWQQECALRHLRQGKGLMTEKEVYRFVMYFERITRHMLATMSGQVSLTCWLTDNHEVGRVKQGAQRF